MVGAGRLAPSGTHVDESSDSQYVQVFISIGVLLSWRVLRRLSLFLSTGVFAVTSFTAPSCVTPSGCRRALLPYRVHARPIFPQISIASDNLFGLDVLFAIVRADVAAHVVVGTREVSRRMW